MQLNDAALVRRAIGTVRLFSNWPPDALDTICAVTRVVRLTPGETLLERSAHVDGLYAVAAGSIEVSLVHADGRRQIRMYASTGQTFGYVAVFGGERSMHAYVAREPSVVLFIPRKTLLIALSAWPQLWLSVVEEMARHLVLSLAAAEGIRFDTIRTRLARVLLSLCDISRREPKAGASIHLPQERLGSLLGVSRQSLSKELKRLEREEAISLGYRCITVLDRNALQQVLQADTGAAAASRGRAPLAKGGIRGSPRSSIGFGLQD